MLANIDKLKCRPICKRCGNVESFFAMVEVRMCLFIKNDNVVLKHVEEDNEDMTFKDAILKVSDLLRANDQTTPIICTECYSTDIDLEPISQNRITNDIIAFAKAMRG